MKILILLFTALASNFAEAQTTCNPHQYGCIDFPKPKVESKILLSCSGITYDQKHAVQLVVRELGPNQLSAIVRATNGESISMAMRHGFGMIIPADSNQSLRIFLNNNDQQNQVMVNWNAEILGPQFMHQPMTCAPNKP